MVVLDCETVETTYQSIEQILGIGKDTLNSLFQGIEDFHRENPHRCLAPDEAILETIRRRVDCIRPVERICWFHLTRAVPGETFERGLLPLGRQIDSIWESLYDLIKQKVTESEWRQFRHRLDGGGSKGHFAGLYRAKMTDSTQWGPYAMLVRDVAFRSHEVKNHDYLKIPEVIEDICKSFPVKCGVDLVSEYRKATRPCIVKFYEERVSDYPIKPALYYLYCSFRNRRLSDYCNTCFNARGIAVPKERFLKIEYLDDLNDRYASAAEQEPSSS